MQKGKSYLTCVRTGKLPWDAKKIEDIVTGIVQVLHHKRSKRSCHGEIKARGCIVIEISTN